MKRNTVLYFVLILLTAVSLLTATGNNPAPETPFSTNFSFSDVSDELAAPPARGYHSMAYDSESHKIIMFGGQNGDPTVEGGWNNETWAFDPSTRIWEKMSPEVAPGGFIGDMTYNSRADRVILVLNTTPSTPNFFDFRKSETWVYDFNSDTWTRMADGPGGRLGAKVVYDSDSDKVILFGGLELFPDFTILVFNETWAYDFTTDTWTEMQPNIRPPEQNYQCMAYDSKDDRVVNWGGDYEGSLWVYDYNTDTWVKKITDKGPKAFYYCGLSYDENADLFILYGGTDAGINETWTYDLKSNRWDKMPPAGHNPGKLSRHTLVYERATKQSVLFGGQTGKYYYHYSAETWLYDLNTNSWTNATHEQ